MNMGHVVSCVLLHLQSPVVDFRGFQHILVKNLQEKQVVYLGKYFKVQRQDITAVAQSRVHSAQVH